MAWCCGPQLTTSAARKATCLNIWTGYPLFVTALIVLVGPVIGVTVRIGTFQRPAPDSSLGLFCRMMANLAADACFTRRHAFDQFMLATQCVSARGFVICIMAVFGALVDEGIHHQS